MDWITLLIEAIGIGIACVFVVVPAREFVEIFRRLRRERGGQLRGADVPDAGASRGGGPA